MNYLLPLAAILMPHTSAFVADDTAAAAAATVTSTGTIEVPTTRPSGAFSVPANFVSFGFGAAWLPEYTNDFGENLINSVAQRMDERPVIRIGGTVADRITFDPSQPKPTNCVSKDGCPDSSRAHFILGPSYFDLFSRFPNARFSFQAPLGENVNKTNVLAYVQRAYKSIGANRVDSIALGNEVGHYEPNGSAYVADAKEAQSAIVEAVSLGNSTIFEVMNTASGQRSKVPEEFTVKDVFQAGLEKDKKIKYVAEHYYQIENHKENSGLQAEIMNHTAITSKFTNFAKSVSYLRKIAPKIQYILSETGSALQGNHEFQSWFGACLWSVDFQLYAMSIGVSRVSGTQRPVARHSLWIPQPNLKEAGPQVRAPYYAQPFVADFVGKTVSGERGVVNIELGSPFLSAYAMFEGRNLARIAVLNLREWSPSSRNGTGRDAIKVSLHGLGKAKDVQVGRLHAAAGTDAGGWDANSKNITWQGQQWSYGIDKGKGHGTAKTGTVNATDGVAEVTIPNSEAVIVYLGKF
ncbi:glycoside hydrolase family 79 protein [Zopfia rhizophila CBS 207.26]|uniref:Glycoside hydrolase family 79 protein n=1 Tax=Zopfia rhizophila CBS 207.26 TaxID=1314779 RepID=A0A6A6EMT7_9PEZI|nr:glycoside hydrolase family 79 protein [Zopfia rhizophila CBS 207.26]